MNSASAQQSLPQSQLDAVAPGETSLARRSFSLPLVSSGTTRPTGGYPPTYHPPITQQQHSSMGVVSPLTYHLQPGVRTVSAASYTDGTPPLNGNHMHLNPISPTQTSGISNFVWNSQRNSFSTIHEDVVTKAIQPKHSQTAHMKHERNSEIMSSSTIDISLPPVPDPSPQYASATKKQRPNGYIAPKQIPDSFTSRVGSHVVGNMRGSTVASSDNVAPPHRQVALRKQLSSGKIECFLNGESHDSMDVEPSEARPRSMSF